MGVRLKPLNRQVMVITGASSGIGLATARAAARHGAAVVLAARNAEALSEIEHDIRAGGGLALAVPADVSQRADVERIETAAVERFGRIDTWVNNAGTSIFGKLEEVSDADHRRLMEVNFWGLVYGSMIAARRMRHDGGAIINLGSVASDITFPMQSMYCATKHAIKGFTDGLRQELEADRVPISVTLIKPAAIGTPFPQNATNYMDVEPKLPEPIYAPEDVAEAILKAATQPVRDVYVGTAGPAFSAAHGVIPRALDWVGSTLIPGQQRTSQPPRDPRGTLRKAGRGGRVHGEQASVPTRAQGSGLGTMLGLGLVGAGLAAVLGARK